MRLLTAKLPSFTRILTPVVAATVVAAAAFCPTPAQAGEDDVSKSAKEVKLAPAPTAPKFYAALLAGGEFDIHATKFVSDGTASFGVPGQYTLPARIESRDFLSAHEAGAVDGRLELGYHVLPWVSVFGGFTYTHDFGNSSLRLGQVTDANGHFGGPAGSTYDLYADTGKYEAFAGMGGVKLNLPRTILDAIHAPKAIKPFVSLSAGGKYLEAQHIAFYSGGGGGVAVGSIVSTPHYALYDDSWVFTGELTFGYDLALTRNWSVTLESGYGYDSKPDQGNLPATILGTDKGGNRVYSTVSLGAKYNF